jgi:hypothetical protein
VTKRALLQRINRALRKREEMVRTLRGERWRNDLGDYFRIDLSRNVILEKHVDLRELGHRLKVLQAWEHVDT